MTAIGITSRPPVHRAPAFAANPSPGPALSPRHPAPGSRFPWDQRRHLVFGLEVAPPSGARVSESRQGPPDPGSRGARHHPSRASTALGSRHTGRRGVDTRREGSARTSPSRERSLHDGAPLRRASHRAAGAGPAPSPLPDVPCWKSPTPGSPHEYLMVSRRRERDVEK